MLTEFGIYAIFVAIEVVVVTIVSGLNYVAWLDDEHERTGLPHRQLFNWYGFTREFGRAQTIGFGFGLLAFSLSATVVSITLIKEALLSIGVSCLSAHFHRDISHFLRESLPHCMGRFFNRRLSVPFQSADIIALKQTLAVESRADHQDNLQAQLFQQLHQGRIKIELSRRMGSSWRDLADWFEIPTADRGMWTIGHEPAAVWEWLESRGHLPQLAEGLHGIGRSDLASVLAQIAVQKPVAVLTDNLTTGQQSDSAQ